MVKVKADKPEQSTLITAVKNVKQKLLTKQLKKPEIKISTDKVTPEKKEVVVPHARGIVYIGHIPHGFFETQMHDYFKQFGKVTRVRLVRSKKTGRSRGYGYVEFQHCEVAKIAAESMNNYLMSGRLLKATYIPPEKQHTGYFSGRQWSKKHYPRMVKRAQQNSQKNKNVDNKAEASLVRRGLDKLSNIEKKLEAAGIVYKIQPVEVPVSEVKKRKAPTDSTSGEAKKIKVAGKPKTSKTKKQVAVAEPAGKKIKTKVTKEVAVKQNKKKIESKVAAVEKKKEEPKSDASVVKNTRKKPKAQLAVAKTAQPVVKAVEKQLPKKSKKVLSGMKISDELMEEVSKAVVAAKKSKKAAAVVTPVEKPKQKKPAGVVAVAGKPKNKKKTAAASPVIEKSMQKKNVVAVPSVKKAKQKSAPAVSQNKKGKNSKKSIAA